MDFRSAFEDVSNSYAHLEQTVNRMSLEQDNLEVQIQSIEVTVSKLLEQEDSKSPADQNQTLIDSCLKVFEQLRGYETDLGKIIDDLNKDVVGRGDGEADDASISINLAVNNFYNAISSIETQLARIQVSLNSFR
jgi:hypothetical protein